MTHKALHELTGQQKQTVKRTWKNQTQTQLKLLAFNKKITSKVKAYGMQASCQNYLFVCIQGKQ